MANQMCSKSLGGEQWVCLSSFGLSYCFSWVLEGWVHLPLTGCRAINILANTRSISRKANLSFRTNSFSKRTFLTPSESGSSTGGLQSGCRKEAPSQPQHHHPRARPGWQGWTVSRQSALGWNGEAAGLWGRGENEYVYVYVLVYVHTHTHTRRRFFPLFAQGHLKEPF